MGRIIDFLSGKNSLNFEKEELNILYKSFHKALNASERGIFDPLRTICLRFDSIVKELSIIKLEEEDKNRINQEILELNKYIGNIQALIRTIFMRKTHLIGFWNEINADLEKVKNSSSINKKVDILQEILIRILKVHSKKQAA